MRHVLASLLLVSGLLLSPTSTGCTSTTGNTFTEGQSALTDGAAFMVTLSSDDGEVDVGMNGFVIHIGMPGTDDVVGGLGIPGVGVTASFVHASGLEAPTPMVRELGDGDYSIESVYLAEPGDWVASFEFTKGPGIDDRVDFLFAL